MSWELSHVLKAPWSGQVLNRIPDRAHGAGVQAEHPCLSTRGSLMDFSTVHQLSITRPPRCLWLSLQGPPSFQAFAVTSPPRLPGEPTTRPCQQ